MDMEVGLAVWSVLTAWVLYYGYRLGSGPQIQERPNRLRQLHEYLGANFDLQEPVFRTEGGRAFCGTVMTDGYIVSVIKQNPTERRGARRQAQSRASHRPAPPEFQHVHNLP